MHIIIDGYNLIRQSDTLRRQERLCLETGRNALIQWVALYRKLRRHQVTIVFDGWENGSSIEERDRQAGIDIIYSCRGDKADDVIKRMAEKKKEDLVVVTSDRDIADFVCRRGATAISSMEFEARINRLLAGVSSSAGLPDMDLNDRESDDETTGDRKKGPARRLSKKKKAAMTTLRKL